MAEAIVGDPVSSGTVTAYKRMLAGIIERRPSGTRQRLSAALARNRSFVSQITNPSYATPIPAAHLETIFAVCHFTAAEQRAFLALYGAAHPKRITPATDPASRQQHMVALPDLGDAARNARLHALVDNFVRQLAMLLEDTTGKGNRR